jgi:hypothetical protein
VQGKKHVIYRAFVLVVTIKGTVLHMFHDTDYSDDMGMELFLYNKVCFG